MVLIKVEPLAKGSEVKKPQDFKTLAVAGNIDWCLACSASP